MKEILVLLNVCGTLLTLSAVDEKKLIRNCTAKQIVYRKTLDLHTGKSFCVCIIQICPY